ncbi:pilus assembly PilX family protein [Neisseria zoodegmatis]|uniref:Pilus assembly protein PilX n=1 Tax=Neisseria zoodegmatis TaxID=326523 RepID=A0A1X3CN64_9NEIS|nr:PilX N-terminal domain-containing pilus assembly protein [Neisseria zoodegmatis]MDO5070111.1 pilus assembly protein PilX [Neisseria zoodegmatis]OSI09065.1 pilus assembly protein PilX [Neisseria zoodegmatis]SNU79419.1 type IV pilus biogenesis protein PilK [Neisseria zoodegmatis]SUA44525.1 type IV pilus biogenesis protein PilK [Neisseria zoodegmatis]
MRKPYAVNYSKKSAQQGFSLFIVLMVMIVVAFFVVSVTQSYNTEQRISTNDADRKFAAALAEAALRAGEKQIAEFDGEITFTDDCKDAKCRAAGSVEGSFGGIVVTGNSSVEAWRRSDGGSKSKLYIDTNGAKLPNSGASQQPRYIIEYISTQNDGSVIYRVTAKAWGKNANTVVVLQSYVSAG